MCPVCNLNSPQTARPQNAHYICLSCLPCSSRVINHENHGSYIVVPTPLKVSVEETSCYFSPQWKRNSCSGGAQKQMTKARTWSYQENPVGGRDKGRGVTETPAANIDRISGTMNEACWPCLDLSQVQAPYILDYILVAGSGA